MKFLAQQFYYFYNSFLHILDISVSPLVNFTSLYLTNIINNSLIKGFFFWKIANYADAY